MLVGWMLTLAMAHGPTEGTGVTVPVAPAVFAEVARAHRVPGASRVEVVQVGSTLVKALTQTTADGLLLTVLDGAGEVVFEGPVLESVRWSCSVCSEPGAWEGAAAIPGGELLVVLAEGAIETTRIGHPLALASHPAP